MLEVRAIEKRQVISLQLPPAVESIVVDQQRIVQILLNYLSNAVKFTPEGGTITISSRLASGLELEESTLPPASTDSIALMVEPDDRFLVLEVTDTGIGISQEKQHLLFQTFQQLDVVSDRKYEGSGLGLSLAKQLAELHGGRVSVCSTLGSGSTFSVWLPL
jgi:signal transduction histidine kinase